MRRCSAGGVAIGGNTQCFSSCNAISVSDASVALVLGDGGGGGGGGGDGKSCSSAQISNNGSNISSSSRGPAVVRKKSRISTGGCGGDLSIKPMSDAQGDGVQGVSDRGRGSASSCNGANGTVFSRRKMDDILKNFILESKPCEPVTLFIVREEESLQSIVAQIKRDCPVLASNAHGLLAKIQTMLHV